MAVTRRPAKLGRARPTVGMRMRDGGAGEAGSGETLEFRSLG